MRMSRKLVDANQRDRRRRRNRADPIQYLNEGELIEQIVLEPEDGLGVLAPSIEGGRPLVELSEDGLKTVTPSGSREKPRADRAKQRVADAARDWALVQRIGPDRNRSGDAGGHNHIPRMVAVGNVQERHAARFRIGELSWLRWLPRASSPAGDRCLPARSPRACSDYTNRACTLTRQSSQRRSPRVPRPPPTTIKTVSRTQGAALP